MANAKGYSIPLVKRSPFLYSALFGIVMIPQLSAKINLFWKLLSFLFSFWYGIVHEGREARPLQAANDGDGAMFRKVILECENRPHSFAKIVQKDAVRLL